METLLSHLRNRMMTWATIITGAVAYAESQGVSALDWLGGLVQAGTDAGGVIYAALVAAAGILQNYLNRAR